MSESKTYLSRRYFKPFDFGVLSPVDRNEVEKSLEFAVGQRLAAVKDRIGQDRFVHLSGKSWKQVSRYLKGDAPPLAVLQAVSAETLVSIEWLVRGLITTAVDKQLEETMLHSAGFDRWMLTKSPKPEPMWSKIGYGFDIIDKRLAALETMQVQDFPSKEPTETVTLPVSEKPPRPSKSTMFTVPRFDEVRPSAGHGSSAVSELPTTRMAFEQTWLTDLGVKAASAVILPAQGDSMEPTIMNGAPMLVDTSKKEVRNGFIYVFEVAGDLMVKRIERLPDGTINLLSDNSEKYPARTLDLESVARMTVIGRVYAAVSKF